MEKSGPLSSVQYTFMFGNQRHSIEYAKGRLVDNPTTLNRIRVTEIPKGTRKFSIIIEGKAKSHGDNDVAIVNIDSIDVCFIDPARPDACGSTPVGASQSAK
jgi:hypothetical protein